LLLDGLASQAGLSINASGLAGVAGGLALRPYRWWEYVWLYKGLGLRAGGLRVLQIGGCVSHVGFLAAMAGNQVLALDGDLRAVESANRAAAALGLARFRAEVGHAGEWARDGAFDRVLSCSVVDRLTVEEQKRTMAGVARALREGGLAGLTFAYGPGEGSANLCLPPPFSPPPDSRSVFERLAPHGLHPAGAPLEEPIAGGLFRAAQARFTIASLFLSKGEAAGPAAPRASGQAPVMAWRRFRGWWRWPAAGRRSTPSGAAARNWRRRPGWTARPS
jgi:hypothetical protein